MSHVLRQKVLAGICMLAFTACGSEGGILDTANDSASSPININASENDGTVTGNPENDGTVAGNPENDGTVAGNPSGTETRMLTGTMYAGNTSEVYTVTAQASDGSSVSTQVGSGNDFSLPLKTDVAYEVTITNAGGEVSHLVYDQDSYFAFVATYFAEGEQSIAVGTLTRISTTSFSASDLINQFSAEDGDYNLDGHMDHFQNLEIPDSNTCALRYSSAYSEMHVPLPDTRAQYFYLKANQNLANVFGKAITLINEQGKVHEVTDFYILTEDPRTVGIRFADLAVDTRYTLIIRDGGISCADSGGTIPRTTISFVTE